MVRIRVFLTKGMTEDDEMLCVYETKTFMETIFGKLPNYPDVIFFKALVLLHKFLRKFSIRQLKVDKCALGTACMFLAAKLEDCPMKLADLAQIYHDAELTKKNLPLRALTEQRKFQIQSNICELESEILRQIGFELEIELPYKYIKMYSTYPGADMTQIVNAAMCFCNDTFLKPLCLYYHPAQIACSCMYYSMLFFKRALPDHDGKPWFKFIHPDIDMKHIQEVSEYMKTIFAKMDARLKAATAANANQQTPVQPKPMASASDPLKAALQQTTTKVEIKKEEKKDEKK